MGQVSLALVRLHLLENRGGVACVYRDAEWSGQLALWDTYVIVSALGVGQVCSCVRPRHPEGGHIGAFCEAAALGSVGQVSRRI